MNPRRAILGNILKVLIPAAILVGIVYLAVYPLVRTAQQPLPTFVPPPTATPAAGTTYTVSRGSITEQIEARGRVTAIEEAFLYFPLGGRLKEIYFTVGQQVGKGDLLAEVDAWDMQGEAMSTRHSLETYRLQIDQAMAAPQPEAVSVLEAEVKEAELSLQRTKDEVAQILADAAQAVTLAENALEQEKIDAGQRITDTYHSLVFARNGLWAAQIERDGIKGDPNAGYRADASEARVGDWEGRVVAAGQAYEWVKQAAEKSVGDQVLRLDKAKADVDRVQTLGQDRIDIAEATLQVARAQLAKLTAAPRPEDLAIYQARITQTEERLTRLENRLAEGKLYAPFDGVILSVEAQTGDLVDAYGPIGALGDPSGSQVLVNILEEDIGEISVGQAATVTLDTYPGRAYGGQVKEIPSKAITWQGKKAYEVVVVFDDLGSVPSAIRMGCDVLLEPRMRTDVLVVPTRAVRTEGALSFVKLQEGGQVHDRVLVEVGLSGQGMVEIVGGLREGQVVVLY